MGCPTPLILSPTNRPPLRARALYSRFYDAFEAMGEPNIPVDKTMMQV